MNLPIFTAVMSSLGFFATVCIGFYTYGKLTQRVADVVDDHKETKATVKDHGQRISRLEGIVIPKG